MPRRYGVELAEKAERDIIAIYQQLREDNPAAALRWYVAVRARIRSLRQLPLRGPLIPEAPALGVPYRHVLVPPYRIIYRVDGNRVLVAHVVHGARVSWY